MWPFKKQTHPPLESFVTTKDWAVIQGKYNGRPMFVRFRAGAKPFAGHPELPYRLGIAVPLKQPDESGLPSREEMQALSVIEDGLVNAIEPAKCGFMVVTITTGGMREFVCYVSSAEVAEIAIQGATNSARGHRVQHSLQHDPQWDVYRTFEQPNG